MSKRYYACVYGGASDRISPSVISEVETLGKIIHQNGFCLVYGAGATGCMGAAARGVNENGGYVMGISPHFINEFESIYPCDNTVMVDTMAERKTLMEKHADIYFVVPGGIGTMDEFFQVLTLKYLKRITEPILIVNIDGFYTSLLNFINDMVNRGAVVPDVYNLFQVINNIDENEISSILQKIK